jgi:hypothetical protein
LSTIGGHIEPVGHCGELRVRTERDLDAARAELARVRRDTSTADVLLKPRRRRSSRPSEGS